MNILHGSTAGISYFIYNCVAFSYGESLQRVGHLHYADLRSMNSRETLHQS